MIPTRFAKIILPLCLVYTFLHMCKPGVKCTLIVAGKNGFGGTDCTRSTYRDSINIQTHDTVLRARNLCNILL